MRQRTIHKVGMASLLILVCVTAMTLAQPPRERGIYGDWLVEQEFDGRTMESIIAFSPDEEGNMTGAWIGFGGVNELKDLSLEDGKISFTQTRQGRDGEVTTKFTGVLADGALSGTVSGGPWGDYEIKGSRMPRIPRAVGDWEMKYTVGDREIVSTLKIRSDEQGNLTATWPSDMVEHTVTDIQSDRRELTFKRTTKMGDQQWDSTFTGTVQGNEITGTFDSEMGSMEATGTRMGGEVIGTWDLVVSSQWGDGKNRLVVYPDMTARYGANLVEKVTLDGDQISFPLEFGWGDRTFNMDFTGKVTEDKLTAQLTSDRGTQEVTGTKVVRRRGPRGG